MKKVLAPVPVVKSPSRKRPLSVGGMCAYVLNGRVVFHGVLVRVRGLWASIRTEGKRVDEALVEHVQPCGPGGAL
jgi:hypothetical protein